MDNGSTKGIDYSKWDKMNFSDDEEEEEEDEESSNDLGRQHTPRVTRLDTPSRVICSTDGSIDIQQGIGTNNETITKPKAEQEEELVVRQKPEHCDDMSPKVSIEKSTTNIIKLLTRNGGSYIVPSSNTQTFWSQDRNEAVLSVVFDSSKISSRDIRVRVKGGLNYNDRHSAVGGMRPQANDDNCESKGEIQITTTTGIELFRGSVAYDFYLSEDEEEVDWEIDATNEQQKMVKITLLKALPMQGLTIWWNKPILGYPDIDVIKDISDRVKKSNDNGEIANKDEEMKDVWDEAHRLFRERVKQREKYSV
jgi:hypothetical protein